MSHFAHLDPFNIVDAVIVAETETISSFSNSQEWIQTSYNTRGGVHYGQDGNPDNGIPLRKNYAGLGYRYDAELDAFIPPQPFPSWMLNESTCLWESPVPYPSDGKVYIWVEAFRNWVEVPQT